MSNTKTHAERELEILRTTSPDDLVNEFSKEIIDLCEAFGNSGQSGYSAPYVAKAISQAVETLMLQQTIAPLTGEDDEWNDVSSYAADGKPFFQNNRDSRVFKNGKTGASYFIEAVVFDSDKGGRFTGNIPMSNGKHIGSFQYIKSFPFTPKTFYIDVIDHRWKDGEETQADDNGGWWTHNIKDENQLKEVFDYYDFMR